MLAAMPPQRRMPGQTCSAILIRGVLSGVGTGVGIAQALFPPGLPWQAQQVFPRLEELLPRLAAAEAMELAREQQYAVAALFTLAIHDASVEDASSSSLWG